MSPKKLSGIEWMFMGVVVICAASIGLLWRVTLDQSHDGAVAKQALCALRHDLEVRVDSSTEFLEQHPNGIPGIPPSVIRQSIRNQQATLESLKQLRCDEGG